MSEPPMPVAGPVPQGRYQPAVLAGGLVYTAGMTPTRTITPNGA